MTVELLDPWRVATTKYLNGSASVRIVNKNGGVICIFKSSAGDKQDIAKIMAACPHMLNLLKAAAMYLNHPDVKSIPFSISSEVVGGNIEKLLKDLGSENAISGN